MDKKTAIDNFFHDFFGTDDKVSTDALYETSVIKKLDPKEILFFEGDTATTMFYQLSGLIKLSRITAEGKETIIHFVNPNEIFAAVAATSGNNYPVTATATKSSEVLGIKIEALKNLSATNPEFAMRLFVYATNRIKYLLDTIDALTSQDARGRLEKYLKNLSITAYNKGADKFRLPIPKNELALLIGTTPETVSRLFTKLESDGVLTHQGGYYRMNPMLTVTPRL